MPKQPTLDKVQAFLANILRLTLVIAVAIGVLNQRWLLVFSTSLILILTYLPYFIEKRYKLYLPIEFESVIILFIYASLFLGEIRSYYTKFWWWDIVLHTTSAALLGMLGFILVYVLNKERRINLFMTPGFIALFSFAFSLALGVAWEIFEFAMDSFFGLHMQKSGLVDTMWDLIVDVLGAAVIAIVGYFSLKHEPRSFLFRHLLRRFVQKNPQLFRKRRKWIRL